MDSLWPLPLGVLTLVEWAMNFRRHGKVPSHGRKLMEGSPTQWYVVLLGFVPSKGVP